MLLKSPPPSVTAISKTARRALWAAAVLDVMVAAWMSAVGNWFDRYSQLSAVVTLGGHHWVVLGLACGGFAALAALAVGTGGFSAAGRVQSGGLSAAVLVSIVAGAGVLSVAILVAGLALLLVVVGWGLLRR